MKKYILSAVIGFHLLHTPASAQQGLGAVNLNSQPWSEKAFDAAKLTEKEISMEINAGKSDIFLDNNYRTIEIKTWNQPKVKVTTKVFFDGKSELTDEQWFSRLNLSLKQAGGQVQILSRNVSSSSYVTAYNNLSTSVYGSGSSSRSIAVFDGDGNNIGTVQNAKRTVTVFIPEGNKLEIENEYGALALSGNLANVNLKSNNGSIEAGDIGRLVIRAKYTPFVLGNVKDAEIEINNGRLKAGTIDKLDIDSKYTTVTIASVNDILLRSSNDEYEIEDAGDVKGRKSYGNLRISNLKTGIDIEGANADIKVRNISAAVETININDKYADIRLPVNSLKNYAVKFSGRYNTVYAPFEKKPLADTASRADEASAARRSSSAGNTYSSNAPATAESISRTYSSSYVNGQYVSLGDASDSRGFTAEAGDTKGRHTKFVINCASCTVDFK